MRWRHRLSVVWREWFGSSALDRETAEELRFHFDRQVEANLAAGMPLEQARRAAALAIGNVESIRESSGESRAGAMTRQFGRDVQYGVRLLTKSPGFALSAIAIVAAGIASVTAIFSVVYGVVLKPLPFPDPDRLVQIWGRTALYERDAVSAADEREWQAQSTVFEGIALYNPLANDNLTGSGEPERLLGARISADLLTVLGVSPILGRNFLDDEDEVGHERVVILGHELWRARFLSDPSVVGRSILLAGIPHEVIGVMGPDFVYPGREHRFWVPLTINPAELARTAPPFGLRAVARLKPGVAMSDAQSEMDLIAARLAGRYAMNKDVGVELVNLRSDLVSNVRTGLLLMLAAVGCLLIVAALNLAGLLATRTAARSREIAVRLALGASRQRVLLQIVAEIVPVLALGGAAGMGLAAAALQSFVPLAPVTLPRVENIGVDRSVLLVSFLVLSAAGLLACVLPAWQAWRSDLTAASRDGARTTGGPRQARARNSLVVAQIALSLPLVAAAALLARTFISVTAVEPGFRTSNVASLHMAIPRSKYRDDPQIAQFLTRILERVQSIPGVESVGMVNRLPLSGNNQMAYVEFDRDGAPPALYGSRVVTPDYFRAMGIRLIEGRSFELRDTAAAAAVAIIDERAARQLWPRESAIGKRVRLAARGTLRAPSAWHEVIGVVAHVRHEGLDQDTTAQVYWHFLQNTQDRAVIVAQTTGDPRGVMGSIVARIRELDPDQPVYDVRMLDEVFDRSVSRRWLAMALVGTFASMALFLCCVGVYGVTAFGVARQRREFGIRLALGATRGAITRAVLNRGLMLALGGAGLGLTAAWIVSRAMQSMLFDVPAHDTASFAIATVAVLVIALIASYFPARRAASIDPATTLRTE